MEVPSADQAKNKTKKCQIEGCSEVTVGCRTPLCRRHRNTKYKQNYKKKKRKAQGIEEKHRECLESQLAEEKYLLERQYASMLQQVLIQKRLEVLNSGSVMQLLRNHQQKVRENKEKEMEMKRKELQLRRHHTQQQYETYSNKVSSASNESTPNKLPSATTGSATGTVGNLKAERSVAAAGFTSAQEANAIPGNQISTLANIVRSVASGASINTSVAPVVSNAAKQVSTNSGKNAHGISFSCLHDSQPSLMPHTFGNSGIAITIPRGNYGTAFTSGKLGLPAGNSGIVQLPGNSGIAVSTVLQTSSVNSGIAMPTPVMIETSRKCDVVQPLGNADVVVWAGNDGIPQTSRNYGIALPTSTARILQTSTNSAGTTVPTGNPGTVCSSGVRTTARNTEMKQTIRNCWMPQALENSAKAHAVNSLTSPRKPKIAQTQTHSAVTANTQPLSLVVGTSFSMADRLRAPSSLGRGTLLAQRASPRVIPIGVRQVQAASNQRGVSTHRRILPHNSAAACNGGTVVNPQACAEGVRQLSLAASKAAAASQPLLTCASQPAYGLQTGRQRVRPQTVSAPTRYPRPTQRILPNQPSASIPTISRQENVNTRAPRGTQIRATGLIPQYPQTSASLASLPIHQAAMLSVGNSTPQQQNFSVCLKGNQPQFGVNYHATGMSHIAPQTVNHLMAGVSAGPTMAQQSVAADVWISQMQTGRSSIQTGTVPPQDELLLQALQVTKDAGLEMSSAQQQSGTLDQLMAEGPWTLSIGL